MKVTLQELDQIFSKIINTIKNSGFHEILLYEDWYWHVCIDSIYDFTKNPQLCIGSIKEEVEDLKNIVKQNDDDLMSTVFIERFAYLLILIQSIISKNIQFDFQEFIKVTVDDLKEFFIKLIKSVRFFGFNEININKDFYNKICVESIINFNSDEPNICTGSLKSDISNLKKIINNEKKLGFEDLEKFAALLLYIHNQCMNKSKDIDY